MKESKETRDCIGGRNPVSALTSSMIHHSNHLRTADGGWSNIAPAAAARHRTPENSVQMDGTGKATETLTGGAVAAERSMLAAGLGIV